MAFSFSLFAKADAYGANGIKHDIPASPVITFDSLKKLITDNNVNSIESLLPLLPKELVSQYALVTQSRSQQEASPSNPRVILFGSNAKFILTFNGDPKQKGYRTLEVTEFKDDTKTFEYREISFSPGGKPSYSQSNPSTCLQCHGTPPRPIWDSYPLWPGTYGSQENELDSARGASKKEETQYQTFWKSHLKDPRYQVLPKMDFVHIYGIDDVISDSSKAPVANSELGLLLNRLNAQGVARDLKMTSTINPLRYALVAASFCEGMSPEEFLPPALRAQMGKSFAVAREETRLAQAKNLADRLATESALIDEAPQHPFVTIRKSDLPDNNTVTQYGTTGDPDTMTSKLRYLAEPFGYSFTSGTLAFPRDSYSSWDGLMGIEWFQAYAWRELLDP